MNRNQRKLLAVTATATAITAATRVRNALRKKMLRKILNLEPALRSCFFVLKCFVVVCCFVTPLLCPQHNRSHSSRRFFFCKYFSVSLSPLFVSSPFLFSLSRSLTCLLGLLASTCPSSLQARREYRAEFPADFHSAPKNSTNPCSCENKGKNNKEGSTQHKDMFVCVKSASFIRTCCAAIMLFKPCQGNLRVTISKIT